jgi:hypothetical protein
MKRGGVGEALWAMYSDFVYDMKTLNDIDAFDFGALQKLGPLAHAIVHFHHIMLHIP